MTAPHLRETSWQQPLMLGMLLLNLLVIVVAVVNLFDYRREREREALTDAQNLTLTLVDDIHSQLDKVDQALQGLSDFHERLRATGFDAGVWEAMLHRQHGRLPILNALRATDAEGRVLYGVDGDSLRGAKIDDRGYFMRLRDQADAGTVFISPVLGQTTQQWVIGLARRLNDRNGGFAGIVYAVIPVDRFGRYVDQLQLGNKGAVTLRDGEQRLIVRYPKIEGVGVGSDTISGEFRAALKASRDSGGYVSGATSLDGVRRVHFYRRDPTYGILVNVGLAEDDFLRAWRGAVAETAGFLAVLAAISLLLVLYARRLASIEAESIERLRRDENKFRLMFERTADAQLLLDPVSEKFVDCNQAALDMLRLSDKGKHLPAHPVDLSPPLQPDGRASADKAHEMIVTALRDGSCRFEWIHRSPYRDDFPVEILLTPIDIEGRLLIVTTWRDISERKQAEDALAASEQRFRDLVNTSDGIVWEAAAQTFCVTFVSKKAEQLFGYPQDDWYRPGFWIEHLHPGDRDWVRAYSTAAIARLEPLDFEYRFVAMDGRVVWVHDLVTVVAEEGVPRWLRGIMIDVTERKRNEEELARHRDRLEALIAERTGELRFALERAEAANRAKSTFLSNMSHELRTPLNSIIGFSRLMVQSPHLDAAERKNLDIINRSGNHLLTLINDVLELSKIEAGRIEVQAEPVDPAALIGEVVDMLRPRAAGAGLALRVETVGLPAAVCVDLLKLRQILINLLSNAIKFTPAGSVALQVLGSPAGGGRVRLDVCVRDTGIGIADEDQARIFDPFVQIDPNATMASTGLGLAITRQYLHLLGSDLSVRSAPGRGSEFRFVLDLPLAHLAAVPAPVASGYGPTARGKRILIVEDNPDARYLLVELLAPMGFELAEAVDGLDALARVEHFAPDLIAMDWRMPNLDGLETTRRIRSLPLARQPKILMLSANALEEQRRQALEAGVDDFLRKPLDMEELFAAIERHLGIAAGEPAQPSPLCPSPTACALSAADLAPLDAEQREALKAAVEELNRQKLDAVLAAVKTGHPRLAATIGRLADEFRFKELWQVFDAGVN